DLAEYVALRGWLDPTDHTQTRRLALPFVELAEGAGRRADRRVRKRARDVETLDHDARHDLRKALKTLRYVVEFCAAAWPAKRSERFVKALKRLQTLFGDLNDAAMAEALFLADDAPAAHDPAAARAAGRLIGGSLAMADHAWEGVLARWRDFEKARRPWV
ncbi:MAG: CHAD domain-containing protein, partial [Pseudomonadota bacterium]